MKRLENLTDLQREILKTLQLGKENAKSLNEIRDYLSKEEVDANIPDLRDEMSKLIAYGAVRGFVEKGGRRYALSRGFGSGYRNQGSLLGRMNPAKDAYRMFKRWFGSIFLLIGLGIFAYQNASISGAVITNEAGNQTTAIISSLLFAATGIFLLFKSFKKD